MNDDVKILLERIAGSLEKIVNILENQRLSTSGNDNNYLQVSYHEENHEEKIDKYNAISSFADLENFLKSRNIMIKSIKEEDAADDVLDKISIFMGNRFSSIKKLYYQIKRNLNTGKGFKLDLKNYRQEEISNITQLCKNLYDIAFLEEYKYFKSPKYILYAKVNRIPKAINFFTGGWLERYIKTAVIESIKSISNSTPVNYSYLKNPRITLPNGDDFELDILFKIEEEIFWFEAKTGDYQRYIEKYSKISTMLNLQTNHSFMILTDITDAGAQALRTLFNMYVIRIDNFVKIFKNIIYDTIHHKITTKIKS